MNNRFNMRGNNRRNNNNRNNNNRNNNNNRRNNQYNNNQYNNNNNNQYNNNQYNNNNRRHKNNYYNNSNPNHYNKNYNNRNNKYEYNTKENDMLNTPWTIYIHNISETDWSLESYKKIFVIRKISDFWLFFNNYVDLQKFNFYVMRGNIKPIYEDKTNLNGYSYSYIIPGRKLNNTFIKVLSQMMCEKLVNIENWDEVCGVSLVPKTNGICIFKIWMKNKDNVLKLKVQDENLINGRVQDHKFY
jgi:hypothetical protein